MTKGDKLTFLSIIFNTFDIFFHFRHPSPIWHYSHNVCVCVCKNVCACWTLRGAGIAQWLERWTRDRKVAGTNPCWSVGIIFSPGSTFRVNSYFGIRSTPPPPPPPRVTAVARKRPWSFCQKHRWQVTAKHAYTLRMWLCMK